MRVFIGLCFVHPMGNVNSWLAWPRPGYGICIGNNPSVKFSRSKNIDYIVIAQISRYQIK